MLSDRAEMDDSESDGVEAKTIEDGMTLDEQTAAAAKRAGVGRFRKRPVVIEAIQLDGGSANLIAVAHFLGIDYTDSGPEGEVYIETLEGTMRADVGDWIIRGVKGEHYPCKPDIFDATYEPDDGALGPEMGGD